MTSQGDYSAAAACTVLMHDFEQIEVPTLPQSSVDDADPNLAEGHWLQFHVHTYQDTCAYCD
jgi:hypothetical protein